MPTLFDLAFDAYQKPLDAQLTKADAALKQTQNEAAQVELSSQASMQSELTKIWGPGSELTAAGSILKARGLGGSQDMPDDATNAKLQATAAAMFKTGNVSDGTSLLNVLGQNKQRQALAQSRALTASATGLKMIGSAFGAVDSQESYTAVLQDLQDSGQDISRFGLSGDFETDAPKLKALANASLTQAQRLNAADRQTKEADVTDYRTNRLAQMSQGLGYQAQRLAQGDRRISDTEAAQADKVTEEAKRDERYQEGLSDKMTQSVQKTQAITARVQPTELAISKELFNSDAAVAAVPQQLRDVYSKEAAQRAKKILADKVKAPGQSYDPADYTDALHQAIGEMQKQGRFDPTTRTAGLLGTGIGAADSYSYQPPQRTAPPANAPAAQQQKPAPLPKAVTSQYKSAADVTAAFSAGKLTRDQAKQILQDQFGAK
jgi:hypothetical protein